MTDLSPRLISAAHPELAEQLEVRPEQAVESWRLTVPAKPACYALEDEHGRAVLVATCADLRAALVRKLAPPRADQGPPTRKVDYASVVRRVRWRTVFSRFEADWAYLENVRTRLPEACAKLVKHLRACWVTVDPEEPYPQFAATDVPAEPAETCFGPVPDSRTARRLVQTLEDLFDLCRYHQILVQAPRGMACTYKQMGRCPAPCDGTISMDAYRQQVRQAVEFLEAPREAWTLETDRRMRAAAAAQQFEEAARLKRQLQRAAVLDSAGMAHLTRVCRMQYVVLQPGDRKRTVRAFLTAPGHITYAGQIGPKTTATLLAELASRAADLIDHPVAASDGSAQRLGLIGHHLLVASRTRGLFLDASEARDVERLTQALGQVASPPVSAAHPAIVEVDSSGDPSPAEPPSAP